MCTAISDGKMFGRTLDYERSYGEGALIIPHGYALSFLNVEAPVSRFAIIGIGLLPEKFPLLFDGINEAGLAMAALNFPISTVYRKFAEKKRNFASFELIPAVLSQCNDVNSALNYLENLNITDDSIKTDIPPTPLHFIISDRERSIVLESTERGVNIYENDFGVLTNEPDFPFHKSNAAYYMSASPSTPQNILAKNTSIEPFSLGLGSNILPGGGSSTARFIRAIYAKSHTQNEAEGISTVSRFFQILSFVSTPMGTVHTKDGSPFGTLYTSAYDRDSSTLYFKTKSNSRIRAVRLSDLAPESSAPVCISMDGEEDILYLS